MKGDDQRNNEIRDREKEFHNALLKAGREPTMPSDYDRCFYVTRSPGNLRAWPCNEISLAHGENFEHPFTGPASDAALPDARKCPHPDGLFQNEHEWDESGIACEACGMAKVYIELWDKAALNATAAAVCDKPAPCKPYAEAALRFFPDKRGVCSVHGGKFEAAGGDDG